MEKERRKRESFLERSEEEINYLSVWKEWKVEYIMYHHISLSLYLNPTYHLVLAKKEEGEWDLILCWKDCLLNLKWKRSLWIGRRRELKTTFLFPILLFTHLFKDYSPENLISIPVTGKNALYILYSYFIYIYSFPFQFPSIFHFLDNILLKWNSEWIGVQRCPVFNWIKMCSNLPLSVHCYFKSE